MNRFPALLLLACAVSAPALAQAPATLGKDFWSNRAFVDKFMGSYGMNSATEPKLVGDESEVLKKFAEQMKTDVDAATKTLARAIRADSHSAQLDFIMGNLNFQAGRVDDAIANYKDAIHRFPDFLRAHNNLGILYSQRGQYPEAITHLAKSIETSGGDAVTYGLMGYCYLKQNQVMSAEIAYRNALVFQPDNNDWILGLAMTLLDGRKYDEATLLLDDMLKSQPSNPDLWLYQARGYLGAGKDNLAAANLEIVRRLGALTPENLAQLGDLYAGTGAQDLALGAYREAITKDPTLPVPGLLHSADLLVASGAYQQGSDLLALIRSNTGRILSEDDSATLLKIQARVDAAQNKEGNAAGDLEKIIESNPLDGEALLLLAKVYARSGEVEKADFLFTRAERVPGNTSEALVEHARFLVKDAHYDKAIPLLERAQSLKPDENVSRYLEQVRAAARSASF